VAQAIGLGELGDGLLALALAIENPAPTHVSLGAFWIVKKQVTDRTITFEP